MEEYVESVDEIFQRAIGQYEDIIESPRGLVLVVGQGDISDLTIRDSS